MRNIQEIIDHKTAMLPDIALRLRLVVDQTANSELTAIVTIGRAIKYLQEFQWVDIARIYAEEVIVIEAAIATIGNNGYHGFRRDLGPVKSTLYKSIAYVSKEVLIRVRGSRQYNVMQDGK